jgi:hypothetical protein
MKTSRTATVLLASIVLGLCLSFGVAPPVHAEVGPCDKTILQAIESFLSLSSFGVTGGITSNSSSFVTVPRTTDAISVFLAEAKRLGFTGETIEQFESWLIHAGFVRINGAEDFTIYERDRFWSQESDGCGPPPPPTVAGATQGAPSPTLPALEGQIWAFGLALIAVCAFLLAHLLRATPLQQQM